MNHVLKYSKNFLDNALPNRINNSSTQRYKLQYAEPSKNLIQEEK